MKSRLALFLISVFVISSFASAFALNADAASSKGPSLFLSPLPSRLPTSSGTSFPALVVSLRDSSGNPTVAVNNTTVYLASSEEPVLSVQSSVVIPAGAQYKIAAVTTTPTPGLSNITAESSGFNSATATIKTFTPRGYPTQLRVYALPGLLPSGQISTTSFAVVVVDPVGLPARTAQDTVVNLTSSDEGTVKLDTPTVRISFDHTVGYGTFTASGANGTAAITATASGFVSGSTVVTVSGNTRPAIALDVSVAPGNLPADGGQYSVLTVSLRDNADLPAVASTLVHVLLTSSRTDIVTLQQAVDISAGHSFAVVPLTTTPAIGFSNITASATNFRSSSTVANTVSIPPTKLGVYLSDNLALVSARARTVDMVVQLQDSAGNPAQARVAAPVTITFSNNSMFRGPMTVTVAKGSDLVYATLPVGGSTVGTFTAISTGLDSAFVNFASNDLTIAPSISSSSATIHPNETARISFNLQANGLPLTGANVTWTVTGGRVTPAASSTDGAGEAAVTFIPSSTGIAIVTAKATHPLIGSVNSSVDVVVVSWPTKASPSIVQQLFGYLPFIVVGAVVALVLVYVFVIRKRRKKVTDNEEAFAAGEFSGLGQASSAPRRLF